MTEYDRGLLLALWRLQQAHAATVPPHLPHAVGKERYWVAGQQLAWEAQAEHGPRIAQLYGDGYDDAARKRVARALDRLAAGGFVLLWGHGSNITHVKLTPDGEASC